MFGNNYVVPSNSQNNLIYNNNHIQNNNFSASSETTISSSDSFINYIKQSINTILEIKDTSHLTKRLNEFLENSHQEAIYQQSIEVLWSFTGKIVSDFLNCNFTDFPTSSEIEKLKPLIHENLWKKNK